MANYGPAGRKEPERVPDWVLGGVARRRILERLAEPGDGWTGKELELDLELGRAWVFEVLRALKAIGAVEQVPGSRGSYRLSDTDLVALGIRKILEAVRAHAQTPVSRPPRRRQ